MDADTVNACLYLVERYAPEMMKSGGGGLTRDIYESGNSARWITPEKKAKALKLARTGRFTRQEIARRVGVYPNRVKDLVAAAGITLPRGGNGRNIPRRAA